MKEGERSQIGVATWSSSAVFWLGQTQRLKSAAARLMRLRGHWGETLPNQADNSPEICCQAALQPFESQTTQRV